MNWIEHRPLPTYARLQYPTPSGQHPLTPDGVRMRYQESVKDSRLVVWSDTGIGVAGVRAGIDEVAWRLEPDWSLELVFSRPAKGDGHLELSYRGARPGTTLVIVTAARFDEAALSWFRDLLRALQSATGAGIREKDFGVDA